MSNERRRILVVSDTVPLADALSSWLSEAGYEPAVETTFGAAKAHLKTAPHLLITELKLREYNGLHLALRARADGIPTAVIGAPDRGFMDEARHLGVRYVVEDGMHRDDFLLLVEGLLSPIRDREAAHTSFDWNPTVTPPTMTPLRRYPPAESESAHASVPGHRGVGAGSNRRRVLH